MGRLDGQVGIVTGAGRNIGQAIAESFAREGARIAVVDMDESRARAVADGINTEHPGHALPIVCDVSSSPRVQEMVSQVLTRWDAIDVLVNNAAISDRGNIFDVDEAEWDRVMQVTLKSVFLCSKYVAEHMAERGRGGRIINIASTSGHRGRAEATAYPAAKGGVLNFTRTLAVQLGPHGIRVNGVTPNQIGSPVGLDYIPESRRVANLVGRQGMPPDIAAAVVFLASPEADFITGADLVVDGGVMAGQPAPPRPAEQG